MIITHYNACYVIKLITCFARGGLAVAVVMDLEHDAYKQIEVVAS